MKHLLNVLMIATVTMSLVACGQQGGKKNSGRVGRSARSFGISDVRFGQQTVPYIGQQSVSGSGRAWGGIYTGGYFTEEEFNYNLHDFVAATMDSSQLGTVSGQQNANTGVRFWGSVQTNGQFNPNGGGSAGILSQNSELRIVIWDSYAGHYDSTGELITEVPVHMRGTASGEVVGNQARVRFSDDYGWIELNGTFNGQYFQGTAFFDNNGGYANYLGMFTIPTCSFFRCY